MLIVLALVFASFVAIFALQNAQTVSIRIFAWERETSVAVIVLATAAIGALSAVLGGLVRQLKAGIRFRHLRAELAKANRLLEEERERVRALESRLDALVPVGEGAAGDSPAGEHGAPSGPPSESECAAPQPEGSEASEPPHDPKSGDDRQAAAPAGSPPPDA